MRRIYCEAFGSLKKVFSRNVLATFVLIASLAMLAIGATRTHKAYDADEDEFGVQSFTRISDRQLVEDATFSGVTRKEGKLVSTYDRSVPRGETGLPDLKIESGCGQGGRAEI